jgi:hypothetical protein
MVVRNHLVLVLRHVADLSLQPHERPHLMYVNEADG